MTPAVNQIEMHAFMGQAHIRKYCAQKGIVVQSFGSVGAHGLLDDPAVRRIAAARETPAVGASDLREQRRRRRRRAVLLRAGGAGEQQGEYTLHAVTKNGGKK